MSTAQCRRLRDAFVSARARPTKVIVLLGGHDFFSNGINLNTIEAAAKPADESWHNIVAMDDLVFEILTTASHLTVAAVRGNAGAGGAMMALAADRVLARQGIVLNPHYMGMGGLYGSEYWTYSVPRRVGPDRAADLAGSCHCLGARAACDMGLIDEVLAADRVVFEGEVRQRAESLAQQPKFWDRLADKHRQRIADERSMCLADYREQELARMRVNFYGADKSYHEARRRFVLKESRTRIADTVALSPFSYGK